MLLPQIHGTLNKRGFSMVSQPGDRLPVMPAGSRCQICSALSPASLTCDGAAARFHDSFAAFEASAQSGCELCTVLFWNIQKFRWGRDERLMRHAELVKCSDPLDVRWFDMGRDNKGNMIQGLEVVYRDQPDARRVTYSVLQDPSEVELPGKPRCPRVMLSELRCAILHSPLLEAHALLH